MKIWIGIDISMDYFDAAWIHNGQKFHERYENSPNGFLKLIAAAPEDAVFIMEATGTYYLNLALHLHESGRYVSVINPLRIRNYNKADLQRSKSDKSDAYSIARFGTEKKPAPWRPPTAEMAHMQQLRAIADKIRVQINMLSNQRHAFKQSKLAGKEAIDILECSINFNTKLLKVTLTEMDTLARSTFAREMELVTTIPGIGQETAARLLALVGDFGRFECSRQLVSYLGLSPTLKQSGSSVHSRGHISRMGNKQARRALFQCAVSSVKHNPVCKDVWLRMKAQNKPSKVVLIAIANKLVRTAFTLIRTNTPYDPNYQQVSLA